MWAQKASLLKLIYLCKPSYEFVFFSFQKVQMWGDYWLGNLTANVPRNNIYTLSFGDIVARWCWRKRIYFKNFTGTIRKWKIKRLPLMESNSKMTCNLFRDNMVKETFMSRLILHNENLFLWYVAGVPAHTPTYYSKYLNKSLRYVLFQDCMAMIHPIRFLTLHLILK